MTGANRDHLKSFVGCLSWIGLPSGGLVVGWSAAGIWVGLGCMFALGIVGFWILMWLTREQGSAIFGCLTVCLLVVTALICVAIRETS
jgi:hypothetical protein